MNKMKCPSCNGEMKSGNTYLSLNSFTVFMNCECGTSVIVYKKRDGYEYALEEKKIDAEITTVR